MHPILERLRDFWHLATRATGLRRMFGWDRDYHTASLYRFPVQDIQEVAPTHVGCPLGIDFASRERAIP